MKRFKKNLYLAMLMAMGPGMAISMLFDLPPAPRQTGEPFSEQVEYYKEYVDKNFTESQIDEVLLLLGGSNPDLQKDAETTFEK